VVNQRLDVVLGVVVVVVVLRTRRRLVHTHRRTQRPPRHILGVNMRRVCVAADVPVTMRRAAGGGTRRIFCLVAPPAGDTLMPSVGRIESLI
jgi:hypothetical protein